MKKKRSLFGLITAVLSAVLVIFIYTRLSSMSEAVAEADTLARLGYRLEMHIVRKFLVRAVLGVVFAFIGYFARVKWAYVAGCALIILAILKLPSVPVLLVIGILIAALMLAAFVIDHVIQRKR